MNQYQACLRTLLNVFLMVVPNMAMKFHNFDIFYNILLNLWHVVCTRLSRGKHYNARLLVYIMKPNKQYVFSPNTKCHVHSHYGESIKDVNIPLPGVAILIHFKRGSHQARGKGDVNEAKTVSKIACRNISPMFGTMYTSKPMGFRRGKKNYLGNFDVILTSWWPSWTEFILMIKNNYDHCLKQFQKCNLEK